MIGQTPNYVGQIQSASTFHPRRAGRPDNRELANKTETAMIPNAPIFRQTRFEASERLDKHLSLAIDELKPESPTIMRGMQRLAHVTQTVMKDMDAQADAVADRIVAGQARAAVVIQKFGALADGIEQTANDVEAALAQISNDPTQVSGGS